MIKIILHDKLKVKTLIYRVKQVLQLVSEEKEDIELIISEDLTEVIIGEAAINYVKGMSLLVNLDLSTFYDIDLKDK